MEFRTPTTSVISIHALREESDSFTFSALYCVLGFQSTLSVRRATHHLRAKQLKNVISIHALREESDFFAVHAKLVLGKISIHALREESDKCAGTARAGLGDFNPRSP